MASTATSSDNAMFASPNVDENLQSTGEKKEKERKGGLSPIRITVSGNRIFRPKDKKDKNKEKKKDKKKRKKEVEEDDEDLPGTNSVTRSVKERRVSSSSSAASKNKRKKEVEADEDASDTSVILNHPSSDEVDAAATAADAAPTLTLAELLAPVDARPTSSTVARSRSHKRVIESPPSLDRYSDNDENVQPDEEQDQRDFVAQSVREERDSPSSSTASKRKKAKIEEEKNEDEPGTISLTPKLKGNRASSSSSTGAKRKNAKKKEEEEKDDAGSNIAVPPSPAEAAAFAAIIAAADKLAAASLPQMPRASLFEPDWSLEKKRQVLKLKMNRLRQQEGTVNTRVNLKFPDLAKASCGVNGEGGGLFSWTSNRHRDMLLDERARVERAIKDKTMSRTNREKEAAKMRADIYNDIARKMREIEEAEEELNKEEANGLASAVASNEEGKEEE